MPINKCMQNIIVLVIAIATSGCAPTIPTTIPAGFAAYEYENRDMIRAVSPDGVMYRVRREKNEPFAELPFWREALKKRMLDAGYKFMNEAEIAAGQRTGYLLELAAPLGAQDFSYLIALFVAEKELVIVEAAGEISAFQKRRPQIINAIEE